MPVQTRSFGTILVVTFCLAVATPLLAGFDRGRLEVVIDGIPAATYHHRGTIYVEAQREQAYALRLTNPTGERVGVALSVDGLNVIDARHSDAWSASKWILGPYETIDIPGWQVDQATARYFYFTGERSSYGAARGRTENLGVIEAVFFRERRPPAIRNITPGSATRSGAPSTEAADVVATAPGSPLSDEYAATGMGGRTHHGVRRVRVELERDPVASVRIRYEFRPQLISLGVFPRHPAPLQRRERARGFDGFCPEP
jgi:hypothetical protein